MALTTVPAAGAPLRGSVFAALMAERIPLFARKTSDETVNNSAAMQNDDHLFLSVEANSQYRIEARLRQSSGTTPDFKFQFTLPSGASGFYTVHTIGAGAAAYTLFDDNMTLPQTVEGGTAGILAEGLIVVGANAGTVQLQWAQNTANASNTTVFTESYLELRRVA
jgi:hypothetical protein